MGSVNLDISLDTFSRANKRDPEVSVAERQKTKIISWILQLLQEIHVELKPGSYTAHHIHLNF